MQRLARFVSSFGLVFFLTTFAAGQQATPTKVRIGTYDNRSIAVAYAASSLNPVREKMAELDAAKKAGDEKKIKELEAWGRDHQRMLHFQGFARVPVGDLLAPVKDQVAQIAAEEKVFAIVMDFDYRAFDVEAVDVTEKLVELYKPTNKTREMARKVREAKPVSLTVLADLPADK